MTAARLGKKLVLALAVALAAGLLLALPVQAADPAQKEFSDAVGDSGPAADINAVTVTAAAGGRLTITIAFRGQVGENDFGIFVDADHNTSTGDGSGADLWMWLTPGDGYGASRWKARDWTPVDKLAGYSVKITESTVAFSVAFAALGSSRALQFWVQSWIPNLTPVPSDDVPNAGVLRFTVPLAATRPVKAVDLASLALQPSDFGAPVTLSNDGYRPHDSSVKDSYSRSISGGPAIGGATLETVQSEVYLYATAGAAAVDFSYTASSLRTVAGRLGFLSSYSISRDPQTATTLRIDGVRALPGVPAGLVVAMSYVDPRLGKRYFTTIIMISGAVETWISAWAIPGQTVSAGVVRALVKAQAGHLAAASATLPAHSSASAAA